MATNQSKNTSHMKALSNLHLFFPLLACLLLLTTCSKEDDLYAGVYTVRIAYIPPEDLSPRIVSIVENVPEGGKQALLGFQGYYPIAGDHIEFDRNDIPRQLSEGETIRLKVHLIEIIPQLTYPEAPKPEHNAWICKVVAIQ